MLRSGGRKHAFTRFTEEKDDVKCFKHAASANRTLEKPANKRGLCGQNPLRRGEAADLKDHRRSDLGGGRCRDSHKFSGVVGNRREWHE